MLATTLPLKRLRRADLPIDTVELARFLIGALLIHDRPEGRTSLRIVETEAYIVGDAASHCFRGETKRTRPMFLERGHSYVYLNYGVFWLFNISSEVTGVGAGVLVRAGEPVEGIALMEERRPGRSGPDLTNGPGKLTLAMGIGPAQDGMDLCTDQSPLWLAKPEGPQRRLGTSVRIGITKDADRPLRFFEAGNPYVSGPRKLNLVAP